MGGFSAARQRLREWLYDGADRSTPSPNQIDVRARFPHLMKWVLSLWKSGYLALAIDPTTLSDRLSVIVASVVYRGCAIPVAWIVLTDLPPSEAGASWRSLRVRIETGFKALKSVGWQWQKTRRTDPARVERNRLVLAAATLLTLAAGSRVEDAQALKKSPSALRSPTKAPPERRRVTGVFRLGLSALSRLLTKGRMWRRVRLLPEPWPPPPDGLKGVLRPEIPNLPL